MFENNKFFFLPFTFWVVILGIASTYLFYRFIRVYFWKKTTGVIIRSSVKRDFKRGYYLPDVQYRFLVDGREFIGSRVFMYELQSDENTVRSLVSKYPEGKTVEVFYCPFNPKLSVLNRSFNTGTFILFLVFFGMFSVFLYTVFFDVWLKNADVNSLAQKVKDFLHKIFD